MYSELERLKTEGVVDVFQRVKFSRIARPGLVQDVVRASRGISNRSYVSDYTLLVVPFHYTSNKRKLVVCRI